MTEWERWSTGNWARVWNLTMLTDWKCTKQNPSKRMRRIKPSGILRYKWITWSLTRRPDLEIINKKKQKTRHLVDFAACHRVKNKEKEKKGRVLTTCQRTEKNMMVEDTYCDWRGWNGSQRLGKRAGRIRNRRRNRDHLNYSIVKIGQNTEKSPGDLRKLAVTQTPAKDH